MKRFLALFLALTVAAFGQSGQSLDVKQGRALRFQATNVTSRYLSILGPPTMTASYSLTLPASPPSADGQTLIFNQDGTSTFGAGGGGGGAGTVIGPAAAVNNNLAAYDGTSGELLKDAGFSIAGVLAAAAANAALVHQPKDTDLEAIAALSTTEYGRSILAAANAAAAQAILSLVPGVNVQQFNSSTSFLGQSIALSEMGGIAQSTLVGRYSTGLGSPQEITIGPQFSLSGGIFALSTEYQEHHENLDYLIDGTLPFALTLDGGYTVTGPTFAPLPLMTGVDMDLSEYGETYVVTGNATLTMSGTPAVGQRYELCLTSDDDGPYAVEFPEPFYSLNSQTNVDAVNVGEVGEAETLYIVIQRETGRWVIRSGDPIDTSGTGPFLGQDSPLIKTPTIEGAVVYEDGVRQTANPNTTTPGWNWGAVLSDPSAAIDGDVWYLTGTGYRGRHGGVNFTFGTGSGGGTLSDTDIDTSAELNVIVTDNTGTGVLVYNGSPTFTGTVTMDNLVVTTLAAIGWEFEGTEDAHETSVVATDPTADRTQTLPDASGYFALFNGGPIASTRVPFGHTDGTMTTDSVYTYNSGTDTLAVPNLILSTGGALGASTATTPSAGDNDTSVVTSAFVQTELRATQTGTHASPYTTASALSPTWSGPLHTAWMGVAQPVNLPAAASYTGRAIMVYNTGAFLLTIEPNASEVIVRDGTVQTGGVNFTLSSGAGNFVSLISDGARWTTLGYKGTLTVGS